MFEIMKTYNFTTLAPGLLGGLHKNQKVVGVMDFQTAMRYRDVHSVHEQISSSLPGGSLPAQSQTYVMFSGEGEHGAGPLVLALGWIDGVAVEVTSVDVTVVVHGVTTGDVDTIRNLLLSVGYGTLTVTTS